jgi:hypothetical protein
MSSNLLTAAAMETKKAQQIIDCLENHPISLWELRELALSSGGLVNGKLLSFANIVCFKISDFTYDFLQPTLKIY